jgi:predicted Zn-dependent peptidase
VPGEIERAKENLKARLLLSLESTSSRMNRLGRSLVTDVPLVSVDETVRRLEAVTPDEVAALAAELYAPERLSAAGIGPSEKQFAHAATRVNPGLRTAA